MARKQGEYARWLSGMERSASWAWTVCCLALVMLGSAWFCEAQKAGSGDQSSVRVVIETLDPQGHAISAERYGALVPVDAPWSQPAAEAVVARGRPMPEMIVPPGTYRVVCAAAGYAVAFGQPSALEASPVEPVLMTCSPEPTRLATAQVRSAKDHQAIAGARAGSAALFSPCHPRRLSEQGQAFLVRTLVGRSDIEGVLHLGVPDGAAIPLWVEASGYAPVFLPGSVPDSEGALAVIELTPGGGSLEVSLEVDPELPRGLYGLYVTPGLGFRREEATGSGWRLPRPMLRLPWICTDDLRWGSLPSDTYRVWLKPPPLGEHGLLPIELGTVDLTDGGSARLAAQVQAPERLTTRQLDDAPDLRLLLSEPVAVPIERLEVVSWSPGTPPEQVGASVQPVSGGLLVTVRGGCRPGRRYLVATDRRIWTPLNVDDGRCGGDREPRQPRSFDAASVTGIVRPPSGSPVPETGQMVVERPAEDGAASGAALGTYPVWFAPDGSWSSRFPAGEVALGLQTTGFAPCPARQVALAPVPETTRLEPFELSQAAAVLVRVVGASDQVPVAAARVEVFPAAAASGLMRASLEPSFAEPTPAMASGWTDPDGWVRFASLPEAELILRVAAGLSLPTLTRKLETRAGRELVLESVELLRPASLELSIEADDPDALGRFAQLMVIGTCPTCHGLEHGNVRQVLDTERGLAMIPEIWPGEWTLHLYAMDAGGNRNPVGSSQVLLAPSESASVSLRLEGGVYDGLVTFQGEPMQVWLGLRGEAPGGGEPLLLQSDAEGRFTVFLEHPGTYTAQVRQPGGLWRSEVPDVRFAEPGRRVEIRIPEGRIAGHVVDDDERPVARARLRAMRVPETVEPDPAASRLVTSECLSADDGSFVLDHLVPGTWSVRARKGDASSTQEHVALAPDEHRHGVELVLGERERLLGTVLGVDGAPRSGTMWVLEPILTAGDIPHTGHPVEIDSEGRFEIPLTRAAAELGRRSPVGLAVHGPDLPVTAVRGVLANGMTVTVSRSSGRATVELVGPRWHEVDRSGLFLVTGTGAVVPVAALLYAGAAELDVPAGGSDAPMQLRIPSLAPGRWSLVFAPSLGTRRLLWSAGGLAVAPMVSFEVIAGRMTRVEAELL